MRNHCLSAGRSRSRLAYTLLRATVLEYVLFPIPYSSSSTPMY
jgi:hypothetical protein